MAQKLTKERISQCAEKLGWNVSFYSQHRKVYNSGKWDKEILEKYAEFSQISPAGEDFSFTVFYDALASIPEKVREEYQDFDIEEHVTMWLEAKRSGVNGVPDIVTLVHDAEDIEKMILDLGEELLKEAKI